MVLENWVDVAILFVVAAYALQGLQRGFFLALVDLLGFVLALVLAVRFYPEATLALQPYVPLPVALLRPVAFVGLWLLADVGIALAGRIVSAPLDALARLSSVNGFFGIIPGALKGGLVSALVVAFALALPLPEPVKAQLGESAITGRLGGEVRLLEQTLQAVFGEAVLEGIDLATVRPQSDERVPLKFAAADAPVDEESEARLLRLLNDERLQAGLRPLVVDPLLVQAARDHSRDMLARGYFAHSDEDGKSPADRVRAAGVRYAIVGENLALAPTVELAHHGLMESPGHRANILSPQYGRVGVGVADAGLHGKMFTQDFAD
jgi:uncharacterized protein YkwD/uncharacterized membrane protein required for colicin V production